MQRRKSSAGRKGGRSETAALNWSGCSGPLESGIKSPDLLDALTSKSIPAREIEQFVIDQVRSVAQEPELLRATLEQIREQVQTRLDELRKEHDGIQNDLTNAITEMRVLVTSLADSHSTGRQADLLDRIRICEQRLTEIREETCRLHGELVSEQDVMDSLREFDPVLGISESTRAGSRAGAVIERIDYDGDAGTVAVNFRPTGFQNAAKEREEAAA